MPNVNWVGQKSYFRFESLLIDEMEHFPATDEMENFEVTGTTSGQVVSILLVHVEEPACQT